MSGNNVNPQAIQQQFTTMQVSLNVEQIIEIKEKWAEPMNNRTRLKIGLPWIASGK